MTRRPVPFVVVLSLLAAANLFGLWLGLTRRADFVARYPRLDSIWPLYAACPAGSLVALAALWFGKRWGFWLAMVCAIAVLGIELFAYGLAPHLLRVPIAVALLIAAVRPPWRELS